MNTAQIVAIAAGVAGIVFGLVTLFRNKKLDDTSEGKTTGAMMSELGYIKAGVDDIKAEQKEQRRTNVDVMTRLAAVEASSKQAHKRIDDMMHGK